MMLTTAQNATLKAAMLGDANVIAIVGQDQKVADYYNAASTIVAWLPSVPVSVLSSAIDWTNTAVAGGNGGFQALAQASRDAYFALTQGGNVDATQTNIRNGFGSIFPANVANALATVSQRIVSRFEALFTVGNPGVCSVLGHQLTDIEVYAARNS